MSGMSTLSTLRSAREAWSKPSFRRSNVERAFESKAFLFDFRSALATACGVHARQARVH